MPILTSTIGLTGEMNSCNTFQWSIPVVHSLFSLHAIFVVWPMPEERQEAQRLLEDILGVAAWCYDSGDISVLRKWGNQFTQTHRRWTVGHTVKSWTVLQGQRDPLEPPPSLGGDLPLGAPHGSGPPQVLALPGALRRARGGRRARPAGATGHAADGGGSCQRWRAPGGANDEQRAAEICSVEILVCYRQRCVGC